MNIIKRLLLAPVPWLEKHAIDDGEFSPLFRRLGKIMMATSIAILAADPLLSMIRFGYPGFSHPLYYALMAGLIATIYLVMRPNAETSLLQMKRSQNWVVKGAFFSLFGVVLAIEWVITHLPSNVKTSDEYTKHHNDSPLIGSDGQCLDEDMRQNLFMDDMAAPPGW